MTTNYIFHNFWVTMWLGITSTVAAAAVFWYAKAVLRRQHSAQIMIAVGLLFVAISYWCDAFSLIDQDTTAAMRRGAGIVLWPSLLWSAIAGLIQYHSDSKEAERHLREMRDLNE